ncbi:tRNA (adenine(22)-N(1))-methyltransferase TrmK [Virgibacillus massiliensis]|nr:MULTISPECIES: class I SAM-dependent methyltransferase [Virgibacillus]MYL41746.1 tRNA (adenine(22)-N(1))-methyltransferase TrmK [Virgibacillus massiliensis]
MMADVKLSKRLKRVASFLPKGAVFADIGSDHAYLPCYVCKNDQTAKAIAGEVNEGPYRSAVETVKSHNLEDQIDVRLGNGLHVLYHQEARQVVIAGMGGSLIKSILNEGKDKLEITDQIIAQPNVDARAVRIWLITNGYTITDEDLVEENGHFYEIIKSEWNANPSTPATLDEQQLLFGPILLLKKPYAFYKKWKAEAKKLERVIQQMKQAKQSDQLKINQFLQEKKWIAEVTNETNSIDKS